MASSRAALFLSSLAELIKADEISWLADEAVAELVKTAGFASVASVSPPGGENPAHTRRMVHEHAGACDLVVFVGGDGTARDVLAARHEKTPCLGIPAGVKMHSGVFAVSPRAGAKVVAGILRGELVSICERDVRDYDDAEREIMSYGQLRVPEAGAWLQQTKTGGRENEALAVAEIVADLQQDVLDERPLVIGPGGTTSQVKEALGQAGTLRGFDIVTESGWHCDVGVRQLSLFAETAKFIVSFPREQGFLFGRGNQQMSHQVLDRIDLDSQLIILATRTKLSSLEGRPLLVDTGSAAVDERLAGLYEVVTGYEDRMLYRVVSASG
jgi:predicted polyphosphate/ATP-dependent NAD kinase